MFARAHVRCEGKTSGQSTRYACRSNGSMCIPVDRLPRWLEERSRTPRELPDEAPHNPLAARRVGRRLRGDGLARTHAHCVDKSREESCRVASKFHPGASGSPTACVAAACGVPLQSSEASKRCLGLPAKEQRRSLSTCHTCPSFAPPAHACPLPFYPALSPSAGLTNWVELRFHKL